MTIRSVGFPLYRRPSPLEVHDLVTTPITFLSSLYMFPKNIYPSWVACYFESCMIYFKKLNDILKVAWYLVSWINIILACHSLPSPLGYTIKLTRARPNPGPNHAMYACVLTCTYTLCIVTVLIVTKTGITPTYFRCVHDLEQVFLWILAEFEIWFRVVHGSTPNVHLSGFR